MRRQKRKEQKEQTANNRLKKHRAHSGLIDFTAFNKLTAQLKVQCY